MSSHDPPRDTWDDDDDGDADAWDGEPEESDDDDSTIPCPYCRRPIHEDSPRCPYCEQYISAEDAPASPKPLWIILGVIACLLIIYCWIFGFPRR